MPKNWANPFNKKSAEFEGFGQKAFGGQHKQTLAYRKPPEIQPPDLETPEFEAVLYKLKDPALTKRVLSLKKNYPDGTVPELVTMDYLNKKQANYIYQANFGYTSGGGRITPDFVVERAAGLGAVWEIQGDYFHTQRKTPESDKTRSNYFRNKSYNGIRITNYVEIWESRILSQYPEVFDWAMAGIQLGRG